MKREEITELFDQQASVYDSNWQHVAAIKEALHLMLRAAFSKLPGDARILCVGSGTGQEVLFLAKVFPEFRFTLVEPAPEMMRVCRENLIQAGIESRCEFHVGFLESLPEMPLHQAATSLLVSHFLMQPAERIAFFSDIAGRLEAGGCLFNADLTADTESSDYPRALDLWMSVLDHTGMDDTKKQEIKTSYAQDVAILAPNKLAAMLEQAGFEEPLPCFQSGLIMAHVASCR